MAMNIVVDCGNTTAKVGIFNHDRLEEKRIFQNIGELESFLRRTPADNLIVSSVGVPADEVVSWAYSGSKKIVLSVNLPLPIQIKYSTPKTLGVDRIAAVCGASHLFPDQPSLTIDAGTCITYEFLDAGRNYYGGGISPGVRMRFEAMHKLTARLPLIAPIQVAPLVGNGTETSIQSGVMNGVRAEVKGILSQYQNDNPGLKCVVCGGDAAFLEGYLGEDVIVSPDLVLLGLNVILVYNC
jgi:type III pantothenate kinase